MYTATLPTNPTNCYKGGYNSSTPALRTPYSLNRLKDIQREECLLNGARHGDRVRHTPRCRIEEMLYSSPAKSCPFLRAPLLRERASWLVNLPTYLQLQDAIRNRSPLNNLIPYH